jgi:hypothetical protein
MAYTMGQAARATGISKPRLSRAIKAGKISAERHDNGSYTIDPAELHRVYPATVAATVTMERSDTPVVPGDTAAAWCRENELLREMLSDLQRRLDKEGEERRQAQTQLMALLADQRRPWWRPGTRR